MKSKSSFLLIFIIGTFSSIIIYYNFIKDNFLDSKDLIIFWWTPFYPVNDIQNIDCGNVRCRLTQNRTFLNDTHLKAFLFYGSNFDPYDLPLPRFNDVIWALFHEESPKNNGPLLSDYALKLFNLTSTFSRFSDFPITLQHLPSKDALIGATYFKTVEEKNELLPKIAPVLYLQSDCDTPIDRDAYVKELMEYIPVDSYGNCLNNKPLPEELKTDPLNNLYSTALLNLISQYKFTISIENAVCNDYITEKLWRPLIAGSVPIYKGSPSVLDWLPNKESVILIDNFPSPKHLADYLNEMNLNNDLYNNYLEHKLAKRDEDKITNTLLTETLKKNLWGTDSNNYYEQIIDEFQCFICKFINDESENQKLHQSSVQHYNCPLPQSAQSNKINQLWVDHWYNGRCEAQAVHHFTFNLKLNNYSKTMLDHEVYRLKREGLC